MNKKKANPRVPLTIRIPADMAKWIQREFPKGKGKFIERCILESKEWKQRNVDLSGMA